MRDQMPEAFPILLAAMHAAILMAYAISEAKQDAETIAHHRPINHATELASRMTIAGLEAIGLMGLMWFGSHSWLSVTSLIPIGWSAWVMTFRAVLNVERGLPLDYISASNRYDSWFIRAGEAIDVRAGRLAYAVEALVLIAGVLML